MKAVGWRSISSLARGRNQLITCWTDVTCCILFCVRRGEESREKSGRCELSSFLFMLRFLEKSKDAVYWFLWPTALTFSRSLSRITAVWNSSLNLFFILQFTLTLLNENINKYAERRHIYLCFISHTPKSLPSCNHFLEVWQTHSAPAGIELQTTGLQDSLFGQKT